MSRHTMASGEILIAHDDGQCAGEHCCLHHPSNHALNTAPLNWRADIGLMERICPHGIGHPDPDDLEYKSSQGLDAQSLAIHGCDGCCA